MLSSAFAVSAVSHRAAHPACSSLPKNAVVTAAILTPRSHNASGSGSASTSASTSTRSTTSASPSGSATGTGSASPTGSATSTGSASPTGSATSTGSASPTGSATSTRSASTSTSAITSPTTSPASSASTSTTPSSAPSASSSNAQSPSASSTTSPANSSSSPPSPTPTPSSTSPKPSPTPSSTKSPPHTTHKRPQLCVRIESFSTSGEVKAGHTANFAIWVWSTRAASSAAKVHASVASAPYIAAAKFTVCPDPQGSTCDVGVLASGQVDELEATVKVGSFAALGELVQISAKATAAGASSFTGSARDRVVAANARIPNSTVNIPPQQNLPPIPGTGVSPADPSGLFPTVGASPTPSTGSPSWPAPSRWRLPGCRCGRLSRRTMRAQSRRLPDLTATPEVGTYRIRA